MRITPGLTNRGEAFRPLGPRSFSKGREEIEVSGLGFRVWGLGFRV